MSSMSSMSSITIKLFSGDIIEVELHQQESYFSIYRQIWEALSDDIRPSSVYQMNLLLRDELVPCDNYQAEIEPEIYFLFIDPLQYNLKIRQKSFDTVVRTYMPDYPKYTTLTVTIEINKDGQRIKTHNFDILYNLDERCCYDLNESEWEWQDGCRGYRNDEVHVWLSPECYYYMGSDLLFIMIQSEFDQDQLPSIAGERSIQDQFDEELRALDDGTMSYSDNFTMNGVEL